MSLRARLLIALGLVAVVALGAADAVTYSQLRSFLLSRLDQQLEAAHIPVEAAIVGAGTSPGDATPDESLAQALLRVAPDTYIATINEQGRLKVLVPDYERGGQTYAPALPAHITGFSTRSDPVEPTVYFDAPAVDDDRDGGQDGSFRVRACELSTGGILVVAAPLTDSLSTLHRLLLTELAVTAGALVLAGAVGWWLVRLGLRPLAAIERTAATVADGRLEHRVPGESTRTEVGRLAGVLNRMLGRLEDAFATRDATEAELRRSEGRMRRFVADASHELRTPIAAVSAYAELFERGADRRPGDLDRVMSGIRTETARMGHLVDDLLLLARMDEGRPLEAQPVELVGLAAESVHAAVAVGPEWPVELHATEPVEVTGDAIRLRQVIDNLVANIRAHTPPGTHGSVRVRAAGDQAVIEVADDGPGIEPEQAERVFERFFRADPSRSRASGGAGLGLSIVSAIVAAHHGTVDARPGDAGGTVFTVRLARRDPVAP